MKPADRRRLGRAIRVAVPALHEKGPLLAMTPRGRILRGVYLESSSADPRGAYAWAFVQPLFVPRSTIALSLGERLGGGTKTWTADEATDLAAAVENDGIPFIAPAATPEGLLTWRFLDGRSDTYSDETRAYALVAAGRLADGARALRKLAASVLTGPPWAVEIGKRADRLAELAEHDPPAATRQLQEWETATVAALRLEEVE